MNWAFFLAAIYFAVVVLPHGGPHAEPLDFRLMWSAGNAAKNLQLSDLYSKEDNKSMNDYLSRRFHAHSSLLGRGPRIIHQKQLTFTPALIAVFAYFSTDSTSRDFRRFGRASKILYGLGLVAAAWAFAVPGPVALFVTWLATSFSWSFKTTMSFGNMGAILTGVFLFVMLLLRWRNVVGFALAGFLFTCLGAVKPTYSFAVPFLGLSMLHNGRWRHLGAFAIGCAAGAAMALAFPFHVIGGDVTWQGWASYVPRITANDSWLRGGTFVGKFSRSIGHGTPRLITAEIWAAAMNLSTFALWFKISRTAINPREAFALDAGSASAGLLLYLLTGPVTHSHYFLQTAPAAIVAMRRRLAENHLERTVRCGMSLLALFFIGGHGIFRHYHLVRGVNHSIVTFCGVWILLGLMIYDQVFSMPSTESLAELAAAHDEDARARRSIRSMIKRIRTPR